MLPEQDYPALHFVAHHRNWQGPPLSTPYECCHCPFATARGEEHGFYPPNPADPGEGYYACALLGKKATSRAAEDYVWGEQPDCTAEDWQLRVTIELAILMARENPPRMC